jgi:acetyl-CoA carboxylase biotin carboxyl carrier protein
LTHDGRPLTPVASPWLETIQRIVMAVRASDVTELEVEHGEFRVLVRREPSANTTTLVDPSPPAVDAGATGDEWLHRVLAPFTGVFYRAPTPSAKPYVNEGDWVDVDAVIGLVETMKIFNEVTADQSGRVVEFRAQGGQLVHAGDPLVLLEPGERTVAEPELRV